MSIVSGALNFRDVGGLPASGGVTRAGVLFRSGNLAGLDDAGRDALVGLGIRRVVDLRADDEVAVEPSRVGGLDLETIRIPLFLGSVASFFVEDRSLADVYRGLVDESADRMVAVARAVIAGAPALVHCTVGKDRTGVAVALLLDAVGVEHDAIVADYARTEAMLPARLALEAAASAQLSAQLLTAECIVKAAKLRKESRGAHYRIDHPEQSAACAGRIEITAAEGEISARFVYDEA